MNDWMSQDTMLLEPAVDDSLALMAYRKLKSMIVLGGLFPGAPLKEAELSDLLGVSRTPVREALRMLRSEGLVQSTAHRGAHVAQISRKEVLEAYEVREWVEPRMVAKAATNIDELRLLQLEDAIARMPDARLTHDESLRAKQADAEFHELIYQGSGNDVALDLIRRARAITHRASYFVVPIRHHKSREEHLEVLEALRTGNPRKAENAMRKHIVAAQGRIVPPKGGSGL